MSEKIIKTDSDAEEAVKSLEGVSHMITVGARGKQVRVWSGLPVRFDPETFRGHFDSRGGGVLFGGYDKNADMFLDALVRSRKYIEFSSDSGWESIFLPSR